MKRLIQSRTTVLVVAVVVMMLVISIVPAAAQTATPVPPTAVPTSAPVVLTLPTGLIFSETNNWMETFAPVAAIGIGITIALAVLAYLGKLIVGAFKQ